MKELIELLFKSQVETHLTHIVQPSKTLSKHEALSIYYTTLEDLVDTLAETYFGLTEVQDLKVQESNIIKDPVKYFTDLYNTLEVLRKPIKETFIQNQIDECQQLIAHTLYRLKNIIT